MDINARGFLSGDRINQISNKESDDESQDESKGQGITGSLRTLRDPTHSQTTRVMSCDLA